MKSLKMHSPNLTETSISRLQALFPHCVTESKDADGQLQRGIDFDLLRQELSGALVEGQDERYQINWPGKREALLTANAPIAKTLRPCRDESVDFDKTQNLYIEGDNLEVLKLLQETYLGKVKMIYIDPPYNTGKDFIYSDNFTEDKNEYEQRTDQKDEDGNRFHSNLESNGRFHSDWLSMIYPRLKLARNLLREDGVIFISIDDNEQANLKRLCDEVFGEGNFVANVVWQKKYAATNDAKGFSNLHDHILVYCKSEKFERRLLPRTEEMNKPYKHDDNDGKGLWRSDNLLVKSFSNSGVYPIVNPNTSKAFLPSEGSSWRASRETMAKWLVENRIYFGKDGKGAPQLKRYLNEVQNGQVPTTWWKFEDVGHNDAASKELSTLFGSKAPFDTPKPSTLIQQMLKIASDSESLILDFFSGSATTAHAVMQLNAEDGGKRPFIMVQWPEVCDESSEAAKAGYKTITDIGKERIRRAGQKIKTEMAAASSVNDLDIGFRVLKVDTSNMANVFYAPHDLNQSDLLAQIDNIKPDRTDEDILFQVMLDWGVDLSLPIATHHILGKTVYAVADNALVACFDRDAGVDEDLVKSLAAWQPAALRVVFRDAGYLDDATKINVAQIFKQMSPHTDVRCV